MEATLTDPLPPLVTTPKTVAAEVKAYVGGEAIPSPQKTSKVAF